MAVGELKPRKRRVGVEHHIKGREQEINFIELKAQRLKD